MYTYEQNLFKKLMLVIFYINIFFVAQYLILQFLLSQNINLRLPEYFKINY